MTVNRVHRNRNNYSTVFNEGAHDKKLSWQAKGLLWYLFTKPDGWEVMERDLAKQTDAGIKAVRSILKQLEQAGYLVRWCERGDRGYLQWRSEIFESKADAQEWISENAELLKTAVRLTAGTTEIVSSMYPQRPHGSMYPSTVDGQSNIGATVDAQTIDGEGEVIVITELINNGIDQLLNEAITHPSNAIAPEVEPEPEKREGTAAPEAIEPEQPQQPESDTPPLTVEVQSVSIPPEPKDTGEDQFSAAPPLRSQFPNSSEKCDRLFAPLVPWRNSRRQADFSPDFLDYLLRVYLPQVPSYRDRPLSLSQAKSWLNKADFDEQRLGDAWIQWEEYQHWQECGSPPIASIVASSANAKFYQTQQQVQKAVANLGKPNPYRVKPQQQEQQP